MYKINTGFGWASSPQPKSKVIALTLPPENSDCDIENLEAQQVDKLAQLPNTCEIDANNNVSKTSSEQQLEYLLSNLLKYGVLTASAVVLVGGILYLIHHGGEPARYQLFQGEPLQFRSPVGVVQAVFSGSDAYGGLRLRGIIQLGLLLLIATPILRVVISLLTFLLKREFIYVIVTFLVLASLTYSLLGAYY
ncbi:MAG: DUF1634 domain-containing protein [Nostoc sp. ZfuVER08]|uniref:DUF1634 domain-containing protein n=1 Tax=Nostoc punctiforme FACHB-252 TaxID=1357509 RepID=A0ABR8HL79_NOSPU|nr:DUF1634 domain-containing protein [Nostoc punctiforme]MBD2616599.1 DUF1634 domain-containing protein [Nostoc punctiforme FACHB-252]MBL1202120.1 DUF1634 domain-containing protein [Nostoc sp. GBBB01]MDZ8014112.1 DUF1634 domain-containing protein [Nostoc sp. ZfuVER08]